jgi:hypothetical protein
LGPLGTVATNRSVVLSPGDYDDGEFGGVIGADISSLLLPKNCSLQFTQCLLEDCKIRADVITFGSITLCRTYI